MSAPVDLRPRRSSARAEREAPAAPVREVSEKPTRSSVDERSAVSAASSARSVRSSRAATTRPLPAREPEHEPDQQPAERPSLLRRGMNILRGSPTETAAAAGVVAGGAAGEQPANSMFNPRTVTIVVAVLAIAFIAKRVWDKRRREQRQRRQDAQNTAATVDRLQAMGSAPPAAATPTGRSAVEELRERRRAAAAAGASVQVPAPAPAPAPTRAPAPAPAAAPAAAPAHDHTHGHDHAEDDDDDDETKSDAGELDGIDPELFARDQVERTTPTTA